MYLDYIDFIIWRENVGTHLQVKVHLFGGKYIMQLLFLQHL
jgi:hypothetical protein